MKHHGFYPCTLYQLNCTIWEIYNNQISGVKIYVCLYYTTGIIKVKITIPSEDSLFQDSLQAIVSDNCDVLKAAKPLNWRSVNKHSENFNTGINTTRIYQMYVQKLN
jgi:hypothetical protein